MDAVKVVALCIAAAIVYGVLHDQITVRICLEYFTIGHPPVFPTRSPTLLALGWGVLATWWVGVLLGAPLAFAATWGPEPRRSARSLVRPFAVLLACMGATALAAGSTGAIAAHAGWVYLVEPLASNVPSDRHTAFLTALWAHTASYLAGFAGGLFLMARVWHSRRPPQRAPAPGAGATDGA